ncbi:IS1 family transposase [Rhizobium sp. P38BS-XIX]|uniref:IS1/IS1595 family N-terminal zinc-binding domain-containing protein n=1 Tax=Rhizobium sp. P38BS-XIX TaxID=2726740 RepID=UPI001FEF38F4|nr:IS1 family transposase [Rhizobium sp. P38BS-XIX]
MDDDEDIHCPSCYARDFVKNGKVRKMQRFRCRPCGLNFVNDPKHRWPPSSKMLNLVLLQTGNQPEEIAEAARADRWLLEAKEHHPWFIRALAEHALVTVDQDKETMETALTRAWELYAFVTNRNPEHFYDSLASTLYLDMFKIGDTRFREELMEWLAAHSSSPNDSD